MPTCPTMRVRVLSTKRQRSVKTISVCAAPPALLTPSISRAPSMTLADSPRMCVNVPHHLWFSQFPFSPFNV
jgi:hypothetical protein